MVVSNDLDDNSKDTDENMDNVSLSSIIVVDSNIDDVSEHVENDENIDDTNDDNDVDIIETNTDTENINFFEENKEIEAIHEINNVGTTEKTETFEKKICEEEIYEKESFEEKISENENCENIDYESEEIKKENFEALTEGQYQLFSISDFPVAEPKTEENCKDLKSENTTVEETEITVIETADKEDNTETQEIEIEKENCQDILEEPKQEESSEIYDNETNNLENTEIFEEAAETENSETEDKNIEIPVAEENEIEEVETVQEIEVVQETTEEETAVKTEKKETEEEPEIIPKTVEIDFDSSMGKIETALEIRYSSLKLTKFPIKVSNVPAGMSFPDEFTLGNMNLKIGDELLNNCYLRLISNESIKVLEIKNREFKLGLSVSLNNDTINAYGSIRYYEISSLIKTSRIVKVLELLEKIFNGAEIKFKLNKLYGNISAEDRIETMRIKTLENFFEIMNKSGYKFQGNKLPEVDNIFYLLELNSALKENKAIETWCNFNFENKNIDIAIGDSLIVKRIHKFDKNFSIEEKIIMKTPMDKYNIFKEKTTGYRKQCLIELKKING